MREVGLFQSRCLCGDNWLESQISVDKTPEELPAEISWRAFQPLKHLKFKTLRRPPEGVFAALVKVLELLSIGVEKHQAAFSSGTWLTGTPLTYLAPW